MVRLYTGPSRSSRSATIDELLVRQWDTSLLIVPTREYAERRKLAILSTHGLAGAWGPKVLTFQDFVAQLLKGTSGESRRIDTLDQRILLQRSIDRIRADHSIDLGKFVIDSEGFLSHVQRIVAQLKQAAIEPEEFRQRVLGRRASHPLDRLIAELYATYQDVLHEAGVYDLQGQYWVARLMCEQDPPPFLLQQIRTVLLDNFDDFTPSEFNLLESIEPHLEELVFGIGYDHRPGRKDVYTLAEQTVAKIQNSYNVEPVRFESGEPKTYCQFVSENLFWRDPPGDPSPLRANLEVVEYHSPIHEVEETARSIKSLLIDDAVPAKQIALVVRDIRQMSNTLQDVFAEAGVPLRNAQRQSLTETAISGFVLSFFEAIRHWERNGIVELLTSPWFAPDGVDRIAYLGEIPLLARTAQIISRASQWKHRLNRLHQRIETGEGRDIEALLKRNPRLGEACAALNRDVERLDELANTLPAQATVREYAEVTDRLLDLLGIPNIAVHIDEALQTQTENSGLDALRGILARLWDWSRDDSRTVPRSEFASLLRRAMDLTMLELPSPSNGIACMDLESIRHLQFDYVYFLGLNDGAVPRPAPSNAIYSEDDRKRLSDIGIVLDGSEYHRNREIRLFHHLFDVPREALVLSWHAIARDGKETSKSLLLQDVEDLFHTLTPKRPASALEIIAPSPDAVASLRDLRNVAFAPDSPLQLGEHEAFRAIEIGRDIENERYGSAPFGPYDGVFIDSETLSSVASEFDTAHSFSATQIETYASCPFKFFIERILHLEDEEDPDQALSARDRGRILHSILESFHRKYVGKSVHDIPENEARESMKIVASEQFERLIKRSTNVPQGVAAIEQARMLKVMDRYLERERERDDGHWKPTHFEVSFGWVREESEDSLAKRDPFTLSTSEGVVLFSGQIDRVDFSDDSFRIIDYKSSSAPKDPEIVNGKSIQLPVYALALEEYVIPDKDLAAAAYLVPGKKNKKVMDSLGMNDKQHPWPERKETALRTIAESVSGIRAGRFHPTTQDKACRYCPSQHVCRYERHRMEGRGAHE